VLADNKRLILLSLFSIIVVGVFIIGYSFFYLDTNPQVCTEAPSAPLDIEDLSFTTLLEIGETAPDISQLDVYGNNFSLSSFRGKVIVLNFMGTWCASCIWEIGDLIDLHNVYSGEDVEFISIAIESNETVNDIIDFKSKYCADWTFILGVNNTISSFKVELLPTTFVIDRLGVITYSRVGLIDTKLLSNVLDEVRRV